MMKTLRLQTALLAAGLGLLGLRASAQPYTENFDNVSQLTANGWFIQNNSSPLGPNSWYQGIPTSATPDPGPFNAFNGADNAYVAANFASTTGGSGTISNWLVTPNRMLRNGDVFQFYTRRPTTPGGGTEYPDRLEVRMSTNGASTNVGTGATAFGDFSTLLLSINPTLVTNVYPAVWTQYTVTISGLPAPTSGRLAFRYFVTGAGPSGVNSDYIGIDNVVYTPYVCPTLTVTPTTLPGGAAGSAYSQSLSQTGALGTPGYAVTAGALPPGLTLAANGTISGTPTATGTFNFTVTVSDASGCSGSRAYSITTVCPANPINFPAFSPVCSNSPLITLNSASPAGGTYSGTGVSGGQFNPASGTQTITYDITDPYGCAHSSNRTITVNTAPTAAQSPIAALCSNDAPVTLSGGTPAGGNYSGTGVSGGQFDPAAGTQTLTYTYTDANSCTDSETFTVTVNTAPSVSHAAVNPVCSNLAPVTLSGGTPAGGTYTGTGVSGGQFDPAAGTQTVTYNYTDANGCSNETTFSITVNQAPTVTQDAVSPVCSNAGPVTLSGGLPVGGTYSGTGVSGGDFDPAAGTQTLTYAYTDGNGCSGTIPFDVTVNTAPVVTQSPLGPFCSNGADITLSGGVPLGGTYSGTGVTGGEFDPSAGTQTLTYTYTDGNGCSDDETVTVTVNAAPNVSFTLPATVCVYGAPFTFNGLPAGGTYIGDGASGTQFNPNTAGVGNATVTYTYTEVSTGCTSQLDATIAVLECAGINENMLNGSVTAYPNPSTGVFTLSFTNTNDAIQLEVLDIQGKRVQHTQIIGSGTFTHTLDLTHLANGIYYAKATAQGQSTVVKLIKQ